MKKYRVGEVSYNNFGNKMTIVKYNNAREIVVIFDDFNYEKTTTYFDFRRGKVKCPYDKNYSGVGYIGVGKYEITDKYGNKTKSYRTWQNILDRCYKKRKSSEKYYENITVCDEWHNFQLFSKWFDENYYEIDGEEMQLDKDILTKGNEVYSPENCIFVPKRINTLFVNSSKSRGKYPIGVCWNKRDEKFDVHCSVIKDGKKTNKFIGSFSDVYSAFNRYKSYKETYIKKVADEYKDSIPKKLYEAMYNYKINIED